MTRLVFLLAAVLAACNQGLPIDHPDLAGQPDMMTARDLTSAPDLAPSHDCPRLLCNAARQGYALCFDGDAPVNVPCVLTDQTASGCTWVCSDATHRTTVLVPDCSPLC